VREFREASLIEPVPLLATVWRWFHPTSCSP
jgi:hypothetical protein